MERRERDGIWLHTGVATLAGAVLCAAVSGCLFSRQSPEELVLREKVVRVVKQIMTTEPMFEPDVALLEEMLVAVRRRAIRFSARYGTYYWRADRWSVQFADSKSSAMDTTNAMRILPGAAEMDLLAVQVMEKQGGRKKRLVLHRDRKVRIHTGPTSVLTLQRASQQLRKASDIAKAMIDIVQSERSFWNSTIGVMNLLAEIRQEPGAEENDAPMREWRSGRFAVRVDCTFVRTRIVVNGKRRRSLGGYNINMVRLSVSDENGNPLRSLWLRPIERRFTEYGATILAMDEPAAEAQESN